MKLVGFGSAEAQASARSISDPRIFESCVSKVGLLRYMIQRRRKDACRGELAEELPTEMPNSPSACTHE